MKSRTRLIRQAREVLQIEAQGILDLVERIGLEFEQAVEMILQSKGRVILTGIGKSGLIGRKISATLNSTGTPSQFLHPAEALHGDLGMVVADDIVIAISNSGYTKELIRIVPTLKDIGTKLIAFCGDPESPLARESHLFIDVGVEREACPLGLAPTTSSTAALAMGDALAVVLLGGRRFNRSDFKRFHPGGSLGKRLAGGVGEVMLRGELIPLVSRDQTVREALFEMEAKRIGACLVVDDGHVLLGVVTDGDIRRSLLRTDGIVASRVEEIMSPPPRLIDEQLRIENAVAMMEQDGLTVLPVVDKAGRVTGLIHLHGLLRDGQRDADG
ncbi:MAG: KpsF/GutQ family sugar-phosphate isomerase [Deltaproteobacteria bacterium]|nr:KpsF/GutQ family sugar-phosphate isomerase [Deltaproteobacteria bacterium]MBW2076075.1 KpsF/GutQ family sugar-phosphate isomerase [Deltaproteobacteria bacterium]